MGAKRQTRLSHMSFALVIEEMLSGPTTAKAIAEHSGMTHRYVCRLMRTMQSKGVVHVTGWEKDSAGRFGVKAFGLGPGKDAKRPNKTREAVNRDYRTRAARAPLMGTPFAGLGA